MSASPTPYRADGSAVVFAGEEVTLTLRIEPADQMADDTWEQRVVQAGEVVATAEGSVVTAEDDGEPDLTFTLLASDTADLLPSARTAIDLTHFVVRDPGGAEDVVLTAPFQVRLGVRP